VDGIEDIERLLRRLDEYLRAVRELDEIRVEAFLDAHSDAANDDFGEERIG